MKNMEVSCVRELLNITSSDQLESWLKRLGNAEILNDGRYWKNVGDQHSNAGPIESSADPINPLAERIVNSFEAMIELHAAQTGIDPNTPMQAVEQFFGIERGRTCDLDETSARNIAQHISVSFRGIKGDPAPTIEVRDEGIGIHPTDFHNTILALGQSRKGQKKYLIGMYGQGGSSTFDKCQYTVILSRRHPQLLLNGMKDEVGWTIVKKSLDVRVPVYHYLVDRNTGQVPVFANSTADQMELSHGTIVAHIGYRDTGGFATQQITNNAWYTLNYRLFDPLLPWTLVDRRSDAGKGSSRTMRGVPYRIGQLPSVSSIGLEGQNSSADNVAVRDHTLYKHRLPSGSHLKVEWWILQDENIQEGHRRRNHQELTKPYRDSSPSYSQRVIAITRGGQTHAALTGNIFKKAGFKQVARSIIVQVDTDTMTWEEGASFFASNRADLKTASQSTVEAAISAAISLHKDKLRAIEREREQDLVYGRGASDEKAIRRHLDPLIRAFQRQNSGGHSKAGQNGRRDQAFRGKQVPTYLRFARTSKLEVRPGIPTYFELLTDAADSVMRNRRTTLQAESSLQDSPLGPPNGTSGRYRINIFPSGSLPIGTQFELSAYVKQGEAWYLEAERPLQVTVVPPRPPFVGQNPPSFIRFRTSTNSVQVRRGGARISIKTDACNHLSEDFARFSINSPDPVDLPIEGFSGPNDGEFRVKLKIPEDAPLGEAGEIAATLKLRDGSNLQDRTCLVVIPKLGTGGPSSSRMQPNYEIKDVTEIQSGNDSISWEEMAEILALEEPWNEEDVGAYYKTGELEQQKITFCLNADNGNLREIEKKVAKRKSELSMDSFRTMHRTLLCFHLHGLATQEKQETQSDYWYRDELRRVSATLLYTHAEFIETLDTNEE